LPSSRHRFGPDRDKEELDPVEWELVRADIAMEKARLKASGDWSKRQKFQAQTNARFAAHAASSERMARAARHGHSLTEEERIALWWAVRTPDLSFLMAPPKTPRRPGRP
jgi:hypothetical protein